MSYSSEVLADSPLVYWKLDETSGTSAADSSGNSRTATYLNSPTLGATSLLTDGSGHSMGTAANLGACASIASASWMNTTSGTVEALVTFPGSVHSSNGDAIVSRLVTLDWVLLRDLNGKFTASLWNSVDTRFNAQHSVVASSDTIYHVAFTWDGSNLILYVNGSAVATTPTTGTISMQTAPIEVGRYSQANTTTGTGNIDEVAIYGTALSSTRIAAHASAAFSSSTDATVNAVPFTATAAGAAPTVSASSTVAGVAATATAAFGAPVVAGTGDATVLAAPFTASASVAAPALSADANPSTPAATAIAAFLTPTVSATTSATVTAVPFAAMADFLIPTVSDGSGNRTVTAPAMTATAGFLAPVWTQVLDVATDTTNARHGRRRLASATVTITRPVVAPPATLTFGTKVDKALAYPVPTMVEGRPT